MANIGRDLEEVEVMPLPELKELEPIQEPIKEPVPEKAPEKIPA